MRLARLALALVAAGWIVLLATSPVTALGLPISAAVYAFGSLICHQRPERSLHVALAQMPVCARCCGLYLGGAIGALGALAAPRLPAFSTRPALRRALAVCAVPTAATWLSEVAGLWDPSNITRFAAALPLGAAVAVTVAAAGSARERAPLR